jgi:hypothetical protein
MLFAIVPGALCLGVLAANYITWLVPPARRALDAEAVGYPGTSFSESTAGLLRFAKWAVPLGLVISLVAAALLPT